MPALPSLCSPTAPTRSRTSTRYRCLCFNMLLDGIGQFLIVYREIPIVYRVPSRFLPAASTRSRTATRYAAGGLYGQVVYVKGFKGGRRPC